MIRPRTGSVAGRRPRSHLKVRFAPNSSKPAKIIYGQVDIMVITAVTIEGVKSDLSIIWKTPTRLNGDSSPGIVIRSAVLS
jgi:hypothetical protein